jgi:hypothetical protein
MAASGFEGRCVASRVNRERFVVGTDEQPVGSDLDCVGAGS